jgi:hypothetical protein
MLRRYVNQKNPFRVTWPPTGEPTFFDRYLHQLPTLSWIGKLSLRSAGTIPDFAILQEWHRTDLSNYLVRPKRLSDPLYFWPRTNSLSLVSR